MQEPLLDDARLLEPLSDSAAGLASIRGLAAILEEDPSSHEGDAFVLRRRRAEDVRAEIDERVPERMDPIAPELAFGTALHRRLFTEACLLWRRYGESGGRIVVDTLHTQSLRRFPIDLDPDDALGCSIVFEALQDAFAWSPEELVRLDAEIDQVASNLKVKQAIACAMAQIFHETAGERGTPGSGGEKEAALRVMARLYGPLPFRSGDVDLVVTNSGVFFCIPYDGAALLRDGFEERSEEERRGVERFLRRLEQENTAQTDRFPSFGFFDRSTVDPGLIEDLTRRAGSRGELATLRPEVVSETLATMVQLLPTQLADQYLVHDDWGHGWQEELAEFEWLYSKLKRLEDPVRADTGPFFGGEEAPPLSAAFGSSMGVVRVDDVKLLRTVELDLRGRISVSLNFVLSEMLADLVEHKVVRQSRPGEAPLPSSSLFPARPLKLDLTWFDVSGQARLVWSPYERLAHDPAEQARLARDLERGGIHGRGLDECVRQAAALVAERFRHVAATFVERTMLHAISLEREIERFLRIGDARYDRRVRGSSSGRERWRCPWACIDLLVLVLARFYEEDRAAYFWELPALLREAIPASIERLEDAIEWRSAAART